MQWKREKERGKLKALCWLILSLASYDAFNYHDHDEISDDSYDDYRISCESCNDDQMTVI